MISSYLLVYLIRQHLKSDIIFPFFIWSQNPDLILHGGKYTDSIQLPHPQSIKLKVKIFTFEDIELEKLFIFLKYVNKKLPKGDTGFVDISGSVELSSLRIQKIGEYRLGLEDVSGVLEPMTATGGGGKTEEPLDFQSEIVRKRRDLRGRTHRGAPPGSQQRSHPCSER